MYVHKLLSYHTLMLCVYIFAKLYTVAELRIVIFDASFHGGIFRVFSCS